jgi:hypothetical protein
MLEKNIHAQKACRWEFAENAARIVVGRQECIGLCLSLCRSRMAADIVRCIRCSGCAARLGVSMSKLMAMKEYDSALTPRERTAVLLARKLTRDPVSVNDADYAALRTESRRKVRLMAKSPRERAACSGSW